MISNVSANIGFVATQTSAVSNAASNAGGGGAAGAAAAAVGLSGTAERAALAQDSVQEVSPSKESRLGFACLTQ